MEVSFVQERCALMVWIGSREGYWSVDRRGGQNVMGQILMDIRSYIISQSGLAETELMEYVGVHTHVTGKNVTNKHILWTNKEGMQAMLLIKLNRE